MRDYVKNAVSFPFLFILVASLSLGLQYSNAGNNQSLSLSRSEVEPLLSYNGINISNVDNISSRLHLPGVFDNIFNIPYKVKVKFDSITVHHDYDSRGRADGEWFLSVYVQGKEVDLSAASGPGSGLFDVDEGETLKLL